MATEKDVDFVLSSGDIINDGRLRDNWIGEFFRPAQKLLSHIPYFVALGNHERESELCSQYLRVPGSQWWYSFDLPNMHITALDSMVSYRPGSDQYAWLEKDLEAHKDARWKFLIMHHPPYSSGNHGSNMDPDGTPSEDTMKMAREVLPGLVAKYGIEASFYGHDHLYERSQRNGSYYIVSGGGGAETYKDGGTKSNPYRQFLFAGLHYCVVTIDGNAGHIIAKTPDGKVLDEVDMVAHNTHAVR
jgi:3',5'-cyclic AMP phosphodiesterase CpdA